MRLRHLGYVYTPGYWRALVYMLQSTEYQPGPYVRWLWRTDDFRRVMHRRQLDRTRPVRLLLGAAQAMGLGLAAAGAIMLAFGVTQALPILCGLALAVLVMNPLLTAHLLVLPVWLGRSIIIAPRHRRAVATTEPIFAAHPGMKLAIVGSYGKTSLKELLATVLQEHYSVAVTPANNNVAIAHARFAASLTGHEDLVIIEFGEGAPGDVAKFARHTHPTHAVITGVAPAHLNEYKTLDAAANDLFSVAQFVPSDHVFVNTESDAAKAHLEPTFQTYNRHTALGWKISHAQVSLEGTSFTMTKGPHQLSLTSGLLGLHQVGPLALVAALAHQLGMGPAAIEAAIRATTAHEHRMQPRRLGGAWLIDDTYNGNIEGIRAGTQLLAALPARRKLYVSPGLVDQGEETQRVHEEMGELIAAAHPDLVILMNNSVTRFIEAGLHKAAFSGAVRIENDPLGFYQNIEHFVAVGDVVMMQNDWTDNYA